MDGSNFHAPGIIGLARRAALTGLAALQNRGELLAVEFEEEKNRALELLIWAVAACFLGMMFLAVLTAIVIWLFRPDLRIYAAGGFCFLYMLGTFLALLNLRALSRNSPPPFSDSINEMKKDCECLESLK